MVLVNGDLFNQAADQRLVKLCDGGRLTFDEILQSVGSKATERELEVLRELTTNRSNEAIAEKYNISLNTVKRHIQNMLNKTGYKNRLELAINAKSLGLVPPDEYRNTGIVPMAVPVFLFEKKR